MITRLTTQFTYADVREALVAHYGMKIEGIRIAASLGHAVETCTAKEEPTSAASPQPTPAPIVSVPIPASPLAEN